MKVKWVWIQNETWISLTGIAAGEWHLELPRTRFVTAARMLELGKPKNTHPRQEWEWKSLFDKAILLPINCMILKLFPSVVARHQFLQFGCKGPDTGIFPSQRMQDIQASAWEQISLLSKCCFHQTASWIFAACLWQYMRVSEWVWFIDQANCIWRHQIGAAW